jgi:predicted phage tail protein
VSDLAGYHIHYGTTAGALTSEIDVPGAQTTTYEISNLSAGTYYFTVTAYNSMGEESAPSGEASETI